jgi:hypothetical protein
MSLRSRQRGAALMVMMLIVVMGGAWWLVTGLNAYGNRTAVTRSHNAQVLNRAREALLAYAATLAAGDDLNPGRLPCPEAAGYIGDANNEGIASSYCTLAGGTLAGRLPWKTLGIEQLRDASGEPLWYVVSSGWTLPNSDTRILDINSNKQSNLSVNGQANAAVALIIAPGPQINVAPNSNQIAVGCAARAQSRTPSTPNYLDYIECYSRDTETVRTSVVDNATNPVSNDQIGVVTTADLWTAVEPIIAMRIQRDVAPKVLGVYNTAPSTCASGSGTQTNEWGAAFTCPAGTLTNAVFPFAAPYSTASAAPCSPLTADVSNQPSLAAATAFKGASCSQGLLPISSLTCNTKTNGPCDGTVHAWDVSTVLVSTSSASTTLSTNCGTSTTSQITCSITATRTCNLCFGFSANVTVQVDGANVGQGMRRIDSTVTSGLNSGTVTAALQSNASARTAYAGTVNSSTVCSTPGWFSLPACTVTTTASIPIGVFKDHAFLSANGPAYGEAIGTPDAWFWFLANKWHQVTYYAVSTGNLPGASGACSSGTTCLDVTVAGGTSITDKRAMLVLAGYSLNGTSGSNRALSDFLDDSANTDLNRMFVQNKARSSFNDRFVSISP